MKGCIEMVKYSIRALLLVAVLFSAVVEAHDAPTVQYQVTETAVVESDLLVVTVNVQFTAADAMKASERVNRVALQVIESIQNSNGVTVSSGGYQTWSRQRGKQGNRQTEWTARQTLILKSQKFEPLLQQLGEIQRIGGAVQSLNYTISPLRKREIEGQLKIKAVSRFREQAALYAVAAGGKIDGWELQTVTIHGDQVKPVMPMARGAFAMESAQGITAPAGSDTLSATVSGVIVLAGSGLEYKLQSLKDQVVERLK
jgi:predicted secreted protein